jgi:hypothetical protein
MNKSDLMQILMTNENLSEAQAARIVDLISDRASEGNIICRQLRITGRGRPLLGKTIRRRRPEGAAMRLAERQIRPLLADRSHGFDHTLE